MARRRLERRGGRVMSMKVEFAGLEDLMIQLRNLPRDLADQGGDIVENHAEIARAQLVQRYPPDPPPPTKQITKGLGLREGVELEVRRNPFGTVAILHSKSPDAHLWEFGTEDRATQQGWDRGRAPEHDGGLVPIAERTRRALNQDLYALLERNG